ncbi:hypothetical protein A7978_04755 (plasmid) [Borrelia turicatae]|uniref:Uncharacterized protein n=2 Tax=Borrelia turicatae TaxID=142 RepID=T1ECN9_BORT9|nr:hypothetical protein [Borrelia turicatae]ADN26510.1 hypothetical protein BTA081 [Borrelia turicatae 91E135]ANF34423.1 hypothetical protein A7978_04755 [Borrelia turicatae]UPA14007.1 hypothetical protein bt91E135_001171 [Borrelia turicatae 91E135]UPA15500.1 hypothetical protein btBTE5EL_001182 [Borrelia turicatae]
MVIKKLIFKLFFAVGLLVFFNAFAKESQEFTATYFSNYSGGGDFALHLNNGDSVFVISYSTVYGTSVKIYLELKSDREMRLKSVKLNDSDVCFYDISFGSGSKIGISNRNSLWSTGFNLKFNVCKAKWRALIEDAQGGNLTFYVLCIEVGSGLELKYEFRVSAANLGKLIDLIEPVYCLKP